LGEPLRHLWWLASGYPLHHPRRAFHALCGWFRYYPSRKSHCRTVAPWCDLVRLGATRASRAACRSCFTTAVTQKVAIQFTRYFYHNKTMQSQFAHLEELFLTGDEVNIELAKQIATGLLGDVSKWDFYADWLELADFYRQALGKKEVQIVDLIRYMRRIGISLDRPNIEIEILPNCFAAAAKIVRRINLQETTIISLGEGFAQYQEVEELSIRHSPFAVLPDYLWGWQKLKKLELLHCEISLIPPKIAQLQQLEMLKISSFRYVAIANDINLLPNLLHIHYDVWDNIDISTGEEQPTFPNSICQLSHLQTLHLNGDFRLAVPNDLNLPQLQKLYCFELNHDHFPTAFTNLDQLTDVYISSCKTLDQLPQFLFALPNLRRLYLENIPLSPLDFYQSVQKLPTLQRLTYKTSSNVDTGSPRRFKILWARLYPNIDLQWLRF
jgi:hypothetical protein